jgi:hypothetical protein
MLDNRIKAKLDIKQDIVSKALRNYSSVLTKMRKKVSEAAKKIGYNQNFLSIQGIVFPTFEYGFDEIIKITSLTFARLNKTLVINFIRV